MLGDWTHAVRVQMQCNIFGEQTLYAFPPFSIINKILNKVKQGKVDKILIVAPTWQSQTWYPILISMSIEKPISLPRYQHLHVNPQKQLHPFLLNETLRLEVWTVSGESYLQEAFQRQLPNLFPYVTTRFNIKLQFVLSKVG